MIAEQHKPFLLLLWAHNSFLFRAVYARCVQRHSLQERSQVHSNGRPARPAGLHSLKRSRHSSRLLLCLLLRPPLHHSHSSPSLLLQAQLALPWPHQALKVRCSSTDWSLAAHAEAVMDF